MNNDDQNLRLLSIFHYVVAGIGALFACIPLIHVALGLAMVFSPAIMNDGGKSQPPPAFLGWFFVAFGGMFVLCGWAAAVCTAISGRFLARRSHRTFSLVVAALLCMFMPFGTVLGVFTIVVLSQDSVKRLYEASPGAPVTPEGAGAAR